MKNARFSKAQKKEMKEGLNRFLSVLLTFAMVLQTSPVAYARMDEGGADAYVTEAPAPEEVVTEGAPAVEEEVVQEEAPAEEAPAVEVADEQFANPEDAEPAAEVVETDTTPAEEQPAEAPAEEEEKASIGVYVENATLVAGEDTLTNESGTLDVSAGNDLAFTVTPAEGYELKDGSVKVTVDGNEIVMTGDGSYLLGASEVKDGTQITVVAKKVPVERVYRYEDEYVRVTATLDEASAIPDDAILSVTPVSEDSTQYNYDAYMQALNDTVEGEDVYDAQNTLLYDVAFLWADPETGKTVELQPEEGAVTVKFAFRQRQLSEGLEAGSAANVEVNHLPLVDSAKADTTYESTDISAGDVIVEPMGTSATGANTLEVRTSTFSVFSFSYTVDFTYDGFTYKLPGEGSVLLSEVLSALGIDVSVADIASVDFTDYELLAIEQQDGDWKITSLQSFETPETMTVKMADNKTTYEIAVTDPPAGPPAPWTESDDLSNFINNVIVTGATIRDGKYVVEKDKPYGMVLTFKEGRAWQFDNDATLTYTIPDGVTIPENQTSPMTINVVSGGRTYSVAATLTVTTDGTLSIKFDEGDPNYPRLANANNVSLRAEFTASFDGTVEDIQWGNQVDKDIIIDTDDHADAFAEKSATFDETTGVYTYTIRVTAQNNPKNVNVKDVISGNALIFDNNVNVSGNTSTYTTNPMENGEKGFSYTFAEMQDGEVITITYSAHLDPEVLKTADIITSNQTKNTVTVKKEGGEPHNSEYQNEINFKLPDKSSLGESGTTDDQGNKIYNWKIEYNKLALASAAGDVVKDKIAADSLEYMKYYGDVLIHVYDHSGAEISGSPRSFQPQGDGAWTYTVPSGDTTPYRYVFEYQTVVDQEKIDSLGVGKNLKNESEGPGGKDGDGINVGPATSVTITKDVEKSSKQEISWVAVIHVPEGGLSQAVVTDTLPQIYSGNLPNLGGSDILYDLLKGNVEVTGTIGEESYNIDTTSDQGKVVITFYKDSDKTIPGLLNTSGGHDITVKLTTTVNQTWLEKGYDYPTDYQSVHRNQIDINGTVKDDAEVRFVRESLEKKGEERSVTTSEWIYNPDTQQTEQIDTTTYGYLYSVTLTDVSEAPIVLNDTFDTSLLEVDTSKESDGYNHFWIAAGEREDQCYNDDGHYQQGMVKKVSYSDTDTGIVITANDVPRKPSGDFYPAYKITYWLKLKEGVDLMDLAIASGDGKFDLVNTAHWGNHDSEFKFTTEYNPLTKETLTQATPSDHYATYKITYNPKGASINGGNPITLIDRMNENLSIDHSSVEVEPDDAGISYTFKGETDEEGHATGATIGTFIIPDETPVTITYRAMVIGTGSVTYENTVSANGKTDKTSNTVDMTSSGGGTASQLSIKAMKVDGNNAAIRLPHVKFKLYSVTGLSLYPSDHPKYPSKSEIIETDENGVLDISYEKYGFSLAEGEKYFLEEVDPPEEYQRIDFPYQFTLTENMDEVDWDNYIYFNGETFQIKNWPLEGLVVEKQVESDEEDDLEASYKFRVSILNDDGTVNTDYNEKNGDDQFTNGVVEFELKNKEQKMFWGFSKGTKYMVEEIFEDADGNTFATEIGYDIFDEDGNIIKHETEGGRYYTGELTQEDEVIVFTNKKVSTGSLKVRKTVTENGSTTLSPRAKSTLAGTYTFTLYTDEACTAPYQVDGENVTITVTIPETGAATTSEEVSNLPAGDYWIKETTPTNGSTPVSEKVKVTVVAGKTGDESVIAGFTNNIDTGSLEIEKKVTGTTDKTKQFNFEVQLTPPSGVTLAESYPATHTGDSSITSVTQTLGKVSVSLKADEKLTITGLPAGTTYKVTEITPLPRGYTPGTHSGDAGSITAGGIAKATMKNTYAAEGDVVLKAMKAANTNLGDTPFTFRLTRPDGTTQELSATQGNAVTFDADTYDLAQLDKTDAEGHKYGEFEYKIQEVVPEDDDPATEGVQKDGVTYDETVKTVKVTVTDDGTGELSVKYDGSDTLTVPAFSNTYAAEGKAHLEATKVVSGADWPEGAKATFTVTANDGGALPETPSVTLTEAGQADFGDITFDLSEAGKTYTYTITETAEGFGDGWTANPKTITATVVVGADKGDGTLEPSTVTYSPEDATVTNTYTPDKPSFEKKIKDINDSTGEASGWQDSADYDIGDAVPFKLSAKLPNDVTCYKHYEITFTDQMQDTLTFDSNSVRVELNGESYAGHVVTKIDDQNFKVKLSWDGKDGAIITDKDLNDATVDVYFTATLNDNAKLGKEGNVNGAKLTYSNNPSNTELTEDTLWDYVIAFTYKVDVNKVDESRKALEGAEFKLEKYDKATDAWTAVAQDAKASTASTFSFRGLDDGTYKLTETKAPDGFVKIAPITFEVTAVHNDTWDYTSVDYAANPDSRTTILTNLTGDTITGALALNHDDELKGLSGDVMNTKLGGLTIVKNVTNNGNAPQDKSLDGTYHFQVKDSTGKVVAEPTITITDGKSNTTTVADLAKGKYTVSEITEMNPQGIILLGQNDIQVEVQEGKDAVAPTATFTNTKPGTPEFEKKIKDTNDSTGETSEWQDSADYDIGDAVPYRLTAKLSNDVTSYKKYHVTFHDKMEDTLSFNEDSVKVFVKGEEVTEGFKLTKKSNQEFELTLSWQGEEDADGNLQTISKDLGLDGAEVAVEFTAELLSNARIGEEGNVNAAKLAYSNNPNSEDDSDKDEGTTPWDYVIAFTYKVDVNKVDDETKPLEGAKFKLEKLIKGGDGAKDAWTEVELDQENSTATTFSFKGLDDGTYKLTETAPEGYKAVDPITFTVTAGHASEWGYTSEEYNTQANDRNAILETLTGNKTEGAIEITAAKDTGTVSGTVTNTKLGGIEITKRVKVNGGEPKTEADYKVVDGTYRFTVKDAEGRVVAEPEITITDGKSNTATVEGLLEGEYTVTEQPSDNGLVLLGGNDRKVAVKNGKDAKVETVEFTNSKPGDVEFEKKIKDANDSTGETSDWQDSADYDIGDAVPYRLTARLSNDVTDYRKYHVTFTDQMEKGLTFDKGSVKVTVNGEAVDNYEVSDVDAQSFKVKLTWEGEDGATIADEALNGAEVAVEFTATLNEDAVLGKQGNVNKAQLSYSNNPSSKDDSDEGTTPWDFVIAFTYKVDVNKVTEDAEPLEGAEFKLEKYDKATDAWTTVAQDAKASTASTFSFKGLDDGNYKLTETKAPKGYKAIESVEFTVTAEHEVEWADESARGQVLTSLTGNNESGELELEADEALASLTGSVTDVELGGLIIKKNVTANGKEVTDKSLDGTYHFQVKDAKGEVVAKPTILITNGESGTAAVSNLTAGEYTVTELTDKNPAGMVLLGANDVKVTVEEGKDAVAPTATFTNTKPGTPEFEKKIADINDSTGETSGWQDSADYDIGDAVPYKLHATLSNDVTSYRKYHITFTDELEPSLDFNQVSDVTVNGESVAYSLTMADKQHFTVKLEWGNGVDLIDDESLNGADVEVFFDATLNENAVLGKQGNVNKAQLSYSNNPNSTDDKDEGTTPWDFVIAFTYKVDVNKVDQDDEALEGAEFKLEKYDKATDAWTAVAQDAKASTASTFSFKGLDDGNYKLTETKAPKGYKPIEPVEFTVTADHEVEWADESARGQVLTSLTGDEGTGRLELEADEELSALAGSLENTKLGGIEITKKVTANGGEPKTEADYKVVDGTYKFQVKDAEGNVVAEPEITITDGKSNTATVEDLLEGEYTVTEQPSDNGLVLLGGNDRKVTVKNGKDAKVETVEFTNTKPGDVEFEKKIKDANDSTGETSDWQDSADYDIGDDVPYRLTATLPNDVTSYKAYHITFTDQMEESLTYNKDAKVLVNGAEFTGTIEKTENDHDFKLTLRWAEDEISADLNGAEVEVLFTAELNEQAKLGNAGNVNAAKLTYSNNPQVDKLGQEGDTPWDYVIAFTYKVDVNKVDPEGNALEGAEFKLEKKIKDGDNVEITKLDGTDSNVFSFKGLDDGDYVLTETRTPKGYKLIDPIEFTVTAEHEVVWDASSDDVSFDQDGRTEVLTGLTGKATTGELTLAADKTLSTLTGDVVNEEHEKPSFDKKIQDANDSTGETSDWQDSADYDIGDAVPYRLHAQLPSDVTNYRHYHITFTDQMEESLTFKEIASVKVGDTEVTDYTFNKVDDQNFTLTLEWGDGEKQIDDKSLNGADVYVYFTATLNEAAKLGSEGNVNGAQLTYSNNSTSDTEEDTEKTSWDYVIAFTYKVDINKVDQNRKALEGAEFKLEKKLADGSLKAIDLTAKRNVFTGKGLDDGEYVLTETKAPKGFETIDPITFTVTADHEVVWDVSSDDVNFELDGRTAVLTGLSGNATSGGLKFAADETLSSLTGDVTNTPLSDKTSVSVEKLWLRSGNAISWPSGAKVTVALTADGKKVDEYTLTAKESSHTFANLDKTKEDGKAIVYKVTEVSVTGLSDKYNTTVSGDAAKGFTIKNSIGTTPPDTPKKKLPKTGDVLNQPLMYALAVGGLAIVAFGIRRRRRKDEE